MTLQALRNRVGATDFFKILKAWAREQGHGTGTTAELLALSQRISGRELGDLFTTWLDTSGKPLGY